MMKFVKNVLKIALALIVGCAVGLGVSVAFLALTGSLSDTFFSDLLSFDYVTLLKVAGVALLSAVASALLLITLHEAGHLAAGLLSGYGFVSFRVFNFTLLRDAGGSLTMKRFAVAGTGGQCLLSPPQKPLDQIPTTLYNIGGVLANIIALLFAGIAWSFWSDVPLACVAIAIFAMVDILMIVLNGIPLELGGIANDGMNALKLNGNPVAKRGLVMQLRSNAAVQEGKRPKEMPADWFSVPCGIDYRNALEASLAVMQAGRLVDEGSYEKAYRAYDALYEHRGELLKVYVNEIECELAFLAMVTGRTGRAEEIVGNKNLMAYVETYRNMMSSKERLAFAIKYFIDGDKAGAQAIYDQLTERKDAYLLQGEVKSDLEIMKSILEK